MELRGVCVLLGVLLLVDCSVQQSQPRRKPLKKGTTKCETSIYVLFDFLSPKFLSFFWYANITMTCLLYSAQPHHITLHFFDFLEVEKPKDPAIEQLQKQINDIVQELNLLKEQQALQAGIRSTKKSFVSK